jgi:hypothetical protein
MKDSEKQWTIDNGQLTISRERSEPIHCQLSIVNSQLIKFFKFFQNELSIFADKNIVEIDFAAAERRRLNLNHIEMDLGLVAVRRVRVAAAQRDVKRPADFFVE